MVYRPLPLYVFYSDLGNLNKDLSEKNKKDVLTDIYSAIVGLSTRPCELETAMAFGKALKKAGCFSENNLKIQPLLSSVLTALAKSHLDLFATQLVKAGAPFTSKIISDLERAPCENTLEAIVKRVLKDQKLVDTSPDLLPLLFKWVCEKRKENWVIPLYELIRGKEIFSPTIISSVIFAAKKLPEVVFQLIHQKEFLNRLDEGEKIELFFQSVKSGSLLLVDELLQRGINPIKKNNRGLSILEVLGSDCEGTLFKRIFPNKIFFKSIPFENVKNALYCFIREKNIYLFKKILDWLSQEERELFFKSKSQGRFPFTLLADINLNTATKEILDQFCSIFILFGADPTDLFHEALLERKFIFPEKILKYAYEKDIANLLYPKGEESALVKSLKFGAQDLPKYLLQLGVSVYAGDPSGKTALNELKGRDAAFKEPFILKFINEMILKNEKPKVDLEPLYEYLKEHAISREYLECLKLFASRFSLQRLEKLLEGVFLKPQKRDLDVKSGNPHFRHFKVNS